MRRLAWLLVFLPAVVSAQNTYPPLVKVVPFASLSTAANNGTINYCSDCDTTDPCAGGGSGAFAFRVNGAWSCAVSGAVGAPTAAEYIVAAAHAGLSAERVCTDTATIDCDAGTANQMKFNIVSPLTTQLVGVVGCAAPPFSFNGDLNAGLCLPAVNGIVVQPALYTGTSVGYFYATDAASALFFTDAGAQTSGWQASTDTIGGYINGVQELDFTPGSYRFGFGGLHDQIRIVPGGPGAGVFTGSITGADLTGNRTYAAPDADATFVQPITCGGTDKISAISGVGLATCSADDTGGGGPAAGAYVPGSSSPAVDAANGVWGISNGLVFEGLTANGFETTIAPTDPTAARTQTLPDVSGTYQLNLASTSAAPGATECDAANEVGRLYHQSGDPATINLQLFRCTQTGPASYAWHPVAYQLGTAAPPTCTVGAVFFDSDATAGSNWFGCTSANTWTLMGGGLADPGSNGMLSRTAANTTAARTITAGSGLVVANGDGVAGNPTATVDQAVVVFKGTGAADPPATCGEVGVDAFQLLDWYLETDTDEAYQCIKLDTWALGVHIADDVVLVGTGTGLAKETIPDCDDTGGNHLNYNTTGSAGSRFSCGTSGSAPSPLTSISLVDEFVGTGTAHGTLQWHHWAIAGGTINGAFSTTTHPGTEQLNSHAANDNSGYGMQLLSNGTTNTQKLSVFNEGEWTFDFIVRPETVTNCLILVGLQGVIELDARTNSAAAMWVRFDTDASDATYIAQMCNATGAAGCGATGDDTNSKVVASSITPTNAYTRIRISRTSTPAATYSFQVNNETPKTFCASGCDDDLTGETSGVLQPTIMYLTRTTTGVQDMLVDAFWMQITGLTRFTP